jgi:hypothetical protein
MHVFFSRLGIDAAWERLKASGARVLGNGEPRIGAHGIPVLFLHPRTSTERSWNWSRMALTLIRSRVLVEHLSTSRGAPWGTWCAGVGVSGHSAW